MNRSIKQVLIDRDGMTAVEADDLIEEAKVELNECVSDNDYCGAVTVIREFFGLEEDYLVELLD